MSSPTETRLTIHPEILPNSPKAKKLNSTSWMGRNVTYISPGLSGTAVLLLAIVVLANIGIEKSPFTWKEGFICAAAIFIIGNEIIDKIYSPTNELIKQGEQMKETDQDIAIVGRQLAQVDKNLKEDIEKASNVIKNDLIEEKKEIEKATNIVKEIKFHMEELGVIHTMVLDLDREEMEMEQETMKTQNATEEMVDTAIKQNDLTRSLIQNLSTTISQLKKIIVSGNNVDVVSKHKSLIKEVDDELEEMV